MSIFAKVANYWTENNVTSHYEFKTSKDSLDYFHWRNDQYKGYIDLMPVTGQDNKIILDYGCGPGHDVVGFNYYSKPRKVIAMDVSKASLQETKFRIELHDYKSEIILNKPEKLTIPLDNKSVDYIHSSGVLHHVPDISSILKEFKRIIKLDGKIRIMVYNYDSIWLHLYVAYQKRIVENLYNDLNILEAFSKTTDGVDCPISNVYKPEQFISIANEAGLKCQYLGAAISMWETSLYSNKRFEAIMNRNLPEEHRKFLLNLKMDDEGYPRYRDTYAGVDGCYLLENW